MLELENLSACCNYKQKFLVETYQIKTIFGAVNSSVLATNEPKDRKNLT